MNRVTRLKAKIGFPQVAIFSLKVIFASYVFI